MTLAGRGEADVRNVGDILYAVQRYKPDVVLNCAAVTDVDQCERAPDHAISVNALGAANVAIVCRMRDVPLVHVSTDYVFSGSGGPRDHRSETYPVNSYGLSKLLGESAVMSIMPSNTIVIRVGWLYGVEYPKSQPMEAVLAGSLRTNEEVGRAYIWDNIKGTPTFIGEAAAMVGRAVNALEGASYWKSCVIHAGPQEHPVTWYELLVEQFNILPMKDGMFKGKKVAPGVHSGAWRPTEGGLVPTEGWATHGYRKGLSEFIEEFNAAYVARTGERP